MKGEDGMEEDKKAKVPWDLDEALRIIGPRGRWQMGVYVLICLMYCTLAFHFMSFVFQVDTPSHHCKIPVNATKNDTIPKVLKEGVWVDDSCHMYVNLSVNNDTMPCTDGWEYDPYSGYIRTIVTDFDLVCGANIWVEVSMTISSAAMALGQVFANTLADKFGRKKMFLCGVASRAIANIGRAFAPNMIAYIILDALGWISMTCFASMLLLLVTELFPAEYRSFAATTLEFAWFASMMLCSLVVYLCRDWRVMQLVMHCPLLLGVAYYWLIPESLPWLMVKGRYAEVRKYLEMGSRINKKPIPPGFFEGKSDDNKPIKEPELVDVGMFGSTSSIAAGIAGITKRNSLYDTGPVWVKRDSDKDQFQPLHAKENGIKGSHADVKITWLDVWKSSRMRFITLVLFLLWATNSIVYSSLNLTVTMLSGDRYQNFFFLALAELPAICCFHIALNRWGRRLPISFFHLVAGIALLLTLVEEFALPSVVLSVVLNFVGKFGITASYCSILVYSPELYPTSIRSVYFGLCFFWALVSNLIAPYCRPIERMVPGIVRGICGTLSLIVAVLVVFLPETFRRALPKNLEEVENWSRNVTKEEIDKFNALRDQTNNNNIKEA